MLQIIQSGKQGFYMLNATQKRSTNLMYPLDKIPGDSGDVFSIKVKVYRFEPGKEEPLLFRHVKLENTKLLQNRIQTPCTICKS